nr:MarR family transcriptional regulator [Leucobacter chromiireducens]
MLVLADLARSGPATLQRLAERTRLNRTVTHRVVGALAARGFVTRTEHSYAVAARVRRLSESVFPALRQAAQGPLDRLASETGATVLLQVLDGDTVVVLEERSPGTGLELRARLEVGTRRELSVCPSGTAILMALGKELALTGDDTPGVVSDLNGGVCEAAAPIRTGADSGACVALLAPAVRRAELREHLRSLGDAAHSVELALGTR